MAFRICSLAVELIEIIAIALEPADLCSLRLVCKELDKKIFHYFRRMCLATFQTDLSRKRLQELEALAADEERRHHVRTLLIKGPSEFGQGFAWVRYRSGSRSLSAPPPGVQRLRNILLNKLVNCRSFRICCDQEEEGSYKSDYPTASEAVAIILTMIAETGLPVKSFSVDFKNGHRAALQLRRLRDLQFSKPEFKTAWSHLQELSIAPTSTFDPLEWAVDLVTYAIGLQMLKLNLRSDVDTWFIRNLSHTATLPKLQELKLSYSRVPAEVMSKLLLRFRGSLRVLSFQVVLIQSGGTWVSVFKQLSSELPLLESFSVLHLKEFKPEDRIMFPALTDNPVVPGSQGRKFSLIEREYRGQPRIFGVSYRGPAMNAALEMLGRSAENI